MEEERPLEDFKTKIRRQLKRLLKTAKKQLIAEQRRLNDCSKADHTFHLAQLLQTHYHLLKRGLNQVTVPDWKCENKLIEIPLNPKLSAGDQIDRYFKKAKKLKKGLPFHQEQVLLKENRVSFLESGLEELEVIENENDLNTLIQQYKLEPQKKIREKAEIKRKLPYKQYFTETNFEIWVGKSALENDRLTFSYARGNDLWFHASGTPGSHVVLRIRKEQAPDQESINDALLLALVHSKAKGGAGEVVSALCKNVKKLGKHRKGQVSLSNHKTYYVIYDEKRHLRLKKACSQS